VHAWNRPQRKLDHVVAGLAFVRFGGSNSVRALGPLRLNHPTLVACIGTSRSCQFQTSGMAIGAADKSRSRQSGWGHPAGPNKCRGWSTSVLAPPMAHGADDRTELATLRGEDVLGPRRTHRIEAPLEDAILLKGPQPLR
jgi:hypothetical protein